MKGEKHKEFAVTWVFQIIWGRYLRGNLLINQTQTSDQIQPNNLPAKPGSRAVCFVLGQGRVLKSVTWVSLVAQMVKNPPVNAGDMSSILALGRSPLESPGGKCQPTPILLPEEFHGQRNLAGYSPCGHKKLDTTD